MEALAPRELEDLLARTSRTFALAIPLLEEPLATQVGVAYLLFRIADTLEDAPLWGRSARLEALGRFDAWLAGGVSGPWGAPTKDAGCIDLLARADAVRASLDAFPVEAAAAIRSHVGRTARGMGEFVARQDSGGRIALRDMQDLAAYCYAVAGIVGEMLTRLFVVATPALASSESLLFADAASFGEGLQLVNILKDASADAREGRAYLPASVPRADVFARARSDLARASAYVARLTSGGASRGTRAFCELPVRLAEATLDRVESGGDKLTRDEVARIFGDVTSR